VGAWLLRRLALAVATALAVVVLTFTLTRLAPGEPMLGEPERWRADPEALALQRAAWGLDRPLPEQLARYAGNLLRGDLGESYVSRRPVAAVLADALPNTLLLGAAALLISFAVGIAVGVAQAARRGTAADTALAAVSLTLYSTPAFWLGLLLLLVFGQWLGWLPVGGMTDPALHEFMPPLGRALDVLEHLVLPAVSLGLVHAAAVARFQRGALVDALAAEFVRAARSRGLSERRVLVAHALRSALAPTAVLAGLSVPALVTGAVLVESVFGWPGMGRVTYDAVFARDYNVVTGAALVAGLMVAAGNLVADLVVAFLDPRLPERA
jgi:peptide/nickel transport system permease protein